MARSKMRRIRVVKINIPDGPINESPWHAITDDDGDHAGRGELELALHHALDGLELGSQDVDTLRWLAGWEPTTIAVICSWITRARAQGMEREARHGGS